MPATTARIASLTRESEAGLGTPDFGHASAATCTARSKVSACSNKGRQPQHAPQQQRVSGPGCNLKPCQCALTLKGRDPQALPTRAHTHTCTTASR